MISEETEMGERASRMFGAGAGPYGCVDEGVCVCVCVCESAVCGNERMGKQRKCVESALSRKRGTVVPSLIPCRLPLLLPSSLRRVFLQHRGCSINGRCRLTITVLGPNPRLAPRPFNFAHRNASTPMDDPKAHALGS